MTELQKRILSSVVLGLVGLGCVIIGGEIFFSLLALLCLACLYETYKLPLGWPTRIVFMLYILAAFASAYYFHAYMGWIPFLMLASTIILTDIGGYVIGGKLGGPKLAPRISPSKTWSGAIGGIVLSVVFILLLFVFPMFSQMSMSSVVIMTVLSSIAAQAGDLLESWLKRKAGVKDSSNFIPGHGGFLDRLDSWLGAFLLNGLVLLLLLN